MMNQEELREVLDKHRLWVDSEEKEGTRADLERAKTWAGLT
jgi:hypothetical protein